MFIRRTTTKKSADGKSYFTYRIVESERVDGRVKQRTLINLGRHFSVSREDWSALCARIEQLMSRQVSLLPVDLSNELEQMAQRFATRIITDRSEVIEESAVLI